MSAAPDDDILAEVAAVDIEDLVRKALELDVELVHELAPADAFKLGAELGALAVVLVARMAARNPKPLVLDVTRANAPRAVLIATGLGAWKAEAYPPLVRGGFYRLQVAF